MNKSDSSREVKILNQIWRRKFRWFNLLRENDELRKRWIDTLDNKKIEKIEKADLFAHPGYFDTVRKVSFDSKGLSGSCRFPDAIFGFYFPELKEDEVEIDVLIGGNLITTITVKANDNQIINPFYPHFLLTHNLQYHEIELRSPKMANLEFKIIFINYWDTMVRRHLAVRNNELVYPNPSRPCLRIMCGMARIYESRDGGRTLEEMSKCMFRGIRNIIRKKEEENQVVDTDYIPYYSFLKLLRKIEATK